MPTLELALNPLTTTLLAANPGFSDYGPGIEEFFFDPIVGSGPFAINRVVLLTFLAAGLICLFFGLGARRAQVVPRGIQNVMESVIEFVRKQITLEAIGEGGLRFMPYLLSLFTFIFVANIFEVIPGINFPVTSKIAIPLVLALTTWALFIYVGVREQGFVHYFKGIMFPPGVPAALYLFVTPLELVSTLVVRPLTLTVRLLANLVAGHLILSVFAAASSYILLYNPGFTKVFALGSISLSIAFTAFEILVAFLQAYIFTLLTAVYLAGALEPEH